MDKTQDSDRLIQAIAAYRGVVADPKTFGPVAARIVAEARQARDHEALTVALRAEAWSERARLANERAKALLDEAVRVASRHQLGRRLGEVLVTRAAVNVELGRLVAAQHDLDRAAPLLADDKFAELDLQQAALFQNTGRLSEAAALYRKALAGAEAPPSVRAIMANNLAIIEVQLGHYAAAINRLDQAATLAAGVGPAVVALVAQTRGWVMAQAGRLTESLRLFDEAARLYEAAGLSLGEPYLEHVDALVDLRLVPEASAMAQRAVEQFEAHGVLLMAAEAQLRAAQLALLNDDHAKAAGTAALAASNLRRQRRGRTAWAASAAVLEVEARARAGEASPDTLAVARRAAAKLHRLGMLPSAVEAYLIAGRVAMAIGRTAAARGSLWRAHQLARGAPVLVRLKGHVAAALTAGLDGHDQRVLRHCRDGLRDLTRHRAALPSMELRALASGHGVELGELGLDVLLRGGSPARVLEWMERTRAAALLTAEPPATEGIEEQLAALQVVHAELAQARRDGRGEPPELLAKRSAIESQVRRATWTCRALRVAGGQAVPLAELRRLLDGQVLVEYAVLRGQVFAAVLDARRTRLVPLGPVDPVRLQARFLSFALRRLTRPASPAGLAAARAGADASLGTLVELLLRPLGLPRDAPLVVVPPGELLPVPWSAVHPAPVSVAPSASLWARTRQRRAPAERRVVLVAGPELPGAVAEVEALRGLHREPTVLLPPASTVGSVARALDGAALAHLACHGRLRADNPAFSSLLLSDGPLTVHQLYLRSIAPHLMVLASCDSAADVSYEGNELLGFVSTLIARGTAGLVASPVMVPDTEAVSLMRPLHDLVVRGAPLAVALHAARATLDRADPGAFVNWCAFTAFGAG
jgi:tetratricopeptide (TPR) repeat protein